MVLSAGTAAQKDPKQLIDKLVGTILHIRKLRQQYSYNLNSIIAFDETPVWTDMVADTTVDRQGIKDVPVKSNGHEKLRVSVGLAAKADGTKLKPLIVFAGGVH